MDSTQLKESDISEIQLLFEKLGSTFVWNPQRIKDTLASVHSILIDWDGVFSDGRKDSHKISQYSELDTMGLNMLRFGFWTITGKVLPIIIVTGEENPTAWYVAQRDRFEAVYYGMKNKSLMVDKLKDDFNIETHHSLFIFDDILDLALVRNCTMGIAIKNSAMPLFQKKLCIEEKCAFITANEGSHHGIREVCELLLGLLGVYDFVVENRTLFTAEYQKYLEKKNLIESKLYS